MHVQRVRLIVILEGMDKSIEKFLLNSLFAFACVGKLVDTLTFSCDGSIRLIVTALRSLCM